PAHRAGRPSATSRCTALAPYTDWSLTDVLRGVPGAPGLDRVDVVQPALFAVMVSLAALWRSVGVGHSQGEIAAAHVAGALGLDDAARVVALRSRAIAARAGDGGMAAVALGAAALRPLIQRLRGHVYVATVNGPASTTVAAGADALDELLAACAAAGVDARRGPLIQRLRGHVYVATVNGPASTTVAAGADALDELLAACAAAGVDARR
ncbi:acyltransferase domain-containing protein, partial [Streptomyces sp. t39]|uniref:acyltransferase domain-containing protein n=1 Tax=Streptomyces sp. t39 TaxID=1828156 RepID=UPI0011CD3B77